MTSMMFRGNFIATAMLVAMAASAEAGRGQSPFAGSYAWGDVSLTISDAGLIKGSSGTSNFYKVTLNGKVDDNGSYSFTMSVTYEDQERRGPGPKYVKSTYEYAGTMALTDDGNIVGTPGIGGSFAWLRN